MIVVAMTKTDSTFILKILILLFKYYNNDFLFDNYSSIDVACIYLVIIIYHAFMTISYIFFS